MDAEEDEESLHRSRESEEFRDKGSKYSGASAKDEEEEVPLGCVEQLHRVLREQLREIGEPI